MILKIKSNTFTFTPHISPRHTGYTSADVCLGVTFKDAYTEHLTFGVTLLSHTKEHVISFKKISELFV